METHTYKLPSGATIEIENLPDTTSGPMDVAAEDLPVEIPFATVISPLGELCDLIFTKLKETVKAPESIELELSASLKGKTSFVLVSGEAQGTLKVKLTWTNSD